MRMPVYFTSSPIDRMPDGSKGEWATVFFAPGDDHRIELEAGDFIPPAWLLAFSAKDLKTARFIDVFDRDDDAEKEWREELHEKHGTAKYPYFAVSKAEALRNLDTRRHGFLCVFGAHQEGGFAEMRTFVEESFPDEYILLRTGGLEGIESLQDHLLGAVRGAEALAWGLPRNRAHANFWEEQKQALEQAEDPRYFLYGAGMPGRPRPPAPRSDARSPKGSFRDAVKSDLRIAVGFVLVGLVIGAVTQRSLWFMLGPLGGLGYLIRRAPYWRRS